MNASQRAEYVAMSERLAAAAFALSGEDAGVEAEQLRMVAAFVGRFETLGDALRGFTAAVELAAFECACTLAGEPGADAVARIQAEQVELLRAPALHEAVADTDQRIWAAIDSSVA